MHEPFESGYNMDEELQYPNGVRVLAAILLGIPPTIEDLNEQIEMNLEVAELDKLDEFLKDWTVHVVDEAYKYHPMSYGPDRVFELVEDAPDSLELGGWRGDGDPV